MKEFILRKKLMGTAFELIACAEDPQQGKVFLEAGLKEIERIENLLSEFREHSETSLLNRQADRQVTTVSEEVYQLLGRSLDLSRLSQGSFDISVSPLKKLYSFRCEEFRMPEENEIREALRKTGYEHISLLPGNRVAFGKRGMKISFAAIGKGYAADRVISLWEKMGISGGVVNASGDLRVTGYRADGRSWKAGIADPRSKEIIFQLPMPTLSVATSGDYEQYFNWQGKRYSHTIHPRNGLPVSGVPSVSVFSPSAELSDALATAVSVMGAEEGKKFISRLPRTYCIIIDQNHEIHTNLPAALLQEPAHPAGSAAC